MRTRYLFVLLLLLFLIEGTLMYWLMPEAWRSSLRLSYHFVFVGIVLLSMFRNRYLGLVFGLLFGFMQEVVYASPMLGPHAFCMAMIAYLAGRVAGWMSLTVAKTLAVVVVSIVLYDVTIAAIYRLFQIIHLPTEVMVTGYLMPTLLFNLLFAIAVYVPARKWMTPRKEKREEKSLGA